MKGIVLRPGCVYGYGGSITAMWFGGAAAGSLEVVGDGHNRWATVHADDCADAYVRAASSGLSGEIFNVTDRSRAPVRRLVTAAARAAAFTAEIRWVPRRRGAEEDGALRGRARPRPARGFAEGRRAARLAAPHGGFEDEVETYYAAWKAAQA